MGMGCIILKGTETILVPNKSSRLLDEGKDLSRRKHKSERKTRCLEDARIVPNVKKTVYTYCLCCSVCRLSMRQWVKGRQSWGN